MKRIIKWGVALLAVVAVVALSIKIEPLDQRTTQEENPAQDITRFWTTELSALLAGDRVVDADLFRAELKNNRKLLIDRYGLTLGIGAPYSMLLGGEFEVTAVHDELVRIATRAGAEYDLRTAYVFGNTVREAVGAFSIDDYENTMDFNSLSSELNRRVTEEVVSPVADKITVGSRLRVVGAIDLPSEGLPKGCFELIPLQITCLE